MRHVLVLTRVVVVVVAAVRGSFLSDRRHVRREGRDTVVIGHGVVSLAAIIVIRVAHAPRELVRRVVVVSLLAFELPLLRPAASFPCLNWLFNLYRSWDADIFQFLAPRLVLVVWMVHFMVQPEILGKLDKRSLVGVLQIPTEREDKFIITT